MAKFITIPPEEIARARALYEGTEVLVRDIAKMLGIAPGTLHRKINQWGWIPRNARLRGLDAAAKADIPLEEMVTLVTPHVVTVEKEALIDRVRAAVEREIVAIEAVLARVEGARLRSTDARSAVGVIGFPSGSAGKNLVARMNRSRGTPASAAPSIASASR